MSTRIHWLRPIDQRITACGRNAFHSDFFDGSAAEYLGVSNFCVKCERSAQKEQQPRPRSCKHCGSQAINPGFRERPQGIDLDLCDVCFWRVRAQPEPRPIAEAPKDGEYVLGYWSQQQYPRLRGLRWALVRFSSAVWATESGEPLTDPTHFLPMPPKPEVRK